MAVCSQKASLLRLFLLFPLFLLASCKPVILFTGNSLLDEQENEYGVLTWSVTSKDSDDFQLTGVTIEPGIGAVEAAGSINVFPEVTTTYTLTAYAIGPNNTIYNDRRSVTIHIGPRIDYSLIVDPALRACLESTGFTHIEQFTAVYCVNQGITQLDGIEQFVNVESVALDLNQIGDLAPLTLLPALNLVSVSGNQLVRLDALVASTTLRNIVALNNQIDDVSALAGMPQLLSLALDNNLLFDTIGLESLTGLQALSITQNQLADVTGLGALNELLALDISHNPVTAGVPALRTLTKATVIRSEGNGGVRCLDYANLILALGPVVIFDRCRLF